MNDVYDAVIVGGGHNGLVAACYLGLAGQRVLVLEQKDTLGGATLSKKTFAGVDARLSVYSYLVSLLPHKILDDLGVRFETRRRSIALYTPRAGHQGGLLISNESEAVTRQSFTALTGDEREYQRYQALQALVGLFAAKVWPTLLEPLPSRQALQAAFTTADERRAWEYLVEKPLGCLIEDSLEDDTVRGAVFTDAKIGLLTSPHDPSLLQNRCFIYHNIGQGSGEWRVPVGGMGRLPEALEARGRALGVEFRTGAEVLRVAPGKPHLAVGYTRDGQEAAVDAWRVLFNCSAEIANRLLPGVLHTEQVEGSVFKINMLLRRLPAVRGGLSAHEAFAGTLHINEGYQQMQASYQAAQAGTRLPDLPGEMYCHSLTDPSILSTGLQAQGYHTLTLFGLDVPYAWFAADNERVKTEITRGYLRSIAEQVAEDFESCLALDAHGQPCIEAKSPLDLERELGLPKGNIFHGSLSWPFAGDEAGAGTWGVETRYPNVLMCGSSAQRGGAVSGLPGYYAAQHIFGQR